MNRDIKISNKRLAQIVHMELITRGYDERVADKYYDEVSQQYGYIIIRESDEVEDRNNLMYKKPFVQFYDVGLYINGGELLTVKYGIGYFKIIERTDIEFCPMCGVNLKECEAE